jgi:hypothetical protein
MPDNHHDMGMDVDPSESSVDGYPTEAALDHIRRFEGTPAEFVTLLSDASSYNPVMVEDTVQEFFDRPGKRISYVTHGWSGNEDVIGVVETTVFWLRFWDSVHRGGLYRMFVPDKWWNEHAFLGAIHLAADTPTANGPH